jgi:probable addiction module antidote protein
MPSGKTTRTVSASVPFEAHQYLRTPAMIAGFVEDAIADGDPRFVPIALRTAADAIGGMSVLAERTGLSRETLYRTLSKQGNPRLDTLAAILAAFGLRLSVEPIAPRKSVTRKVATKSSSPDTRSARKTTARKATPKPKPAAPKPARPRR